MKDKKFVTLCILAGIWLIVFIAMLFGIRIHPRVEQMVTVLLVGWFAFWTLSFVFTKKPIKPTETNNENNSSSHTEELN